MISLLAFIVLLGVLITFHEAGHFIVAKLSGVRVHTFSVGFGQALISKQIGETEYRIAWIPLGGYVRLQGMEGDEFGERLETESEEPSALEGADEGAEQDEARTPGGRSLLDKHPLVRILIFLAGPAMNFLLPFILLPPFFYLSSNFDKVWSSKVGAVDEGLPGYLSGLREGDQIIEVQGEPVTAFWQISSAIQRYQEQSGPLQISVRRAGVEAPIELTVTPEQLFERSQILQESRSKPRVGFQPFALAADVLPERPDGVAARAGLRPFDRIISVGGQAVERYQSLSVHLNAAPQDAPLVLEVERPRGLSAPFDFLHARERLTLTLPAPATWGDEGLGLRPAAPCVSSIDPQGPAAGLLEVGDCIVSVDGVQHSLPVFILTRLRHAPEQPKVLTVLRGGERLERTLQPVQRSREDDLAGTLSFWSHGFVLFGAVHRDAFSSPDWVENESRSDFAWHQTVDRVSRDFSHSLSSLTGMFSGRVSPSQLGGPVMIFYLAGEQAKAGFDRFLFLMVTISLSIALLNLLPIPGLDGGQILLAGVELVIRRPLPPRLRMALQGFGVLLILGLIFFALGNDLMRMWRLSS